MLVTRQFYSQQSKNRLFRDFSLDDGRQCPGTVPVFPLPLESICSHDC